MARQRRFPRPIVAEDDNIFALLNRQRDRLQREDWLRGVGIVGVV